jgi:radical SAM superfamily enzyme YgiQ (UPF0313 family)
MRKKIKVGLVQLNNSFSNQYYLPLSVGMLQAYALKHLSDPSKIIFKDSLFKFMRISDASDYLKDCDIVGFSVYVWNEQNSLAIAKEYKTLNPNGVVVFGGPQVPNSHKKFSRFKNIEITSQEKKQKRINFTSDYHKKYPFIDMLCHGEGERAFTAILESMIQNNCNHKESIPSISYIDSLGNFQFNKIIERMKDEDLALTPSPFQMGVFDGLMQNESDKKWIVMYETDRGCPYMCTYCDWGGATEDKVSKFTLDQIYNDLKWIGLKKIPYIFLCNANFGILKRDVDIARYFAEIKKDYGYLEGLSTQNAKNPKAHTLEALEILDKAGLNKATVMSQQSLNPKTLEAVRRDNMKLDEYQKMQNQLASEGIYTMTDLIFPMPNETYLSVVDAIDTLISNGQHNKIQFNNLSILRNTEMGNPEYQEKYGMEIIKSKIINSHGSKNENISGIEEYQELVVATNTMPKEDWVKTRVFCWLTNFLYFNKVIQVPLTLMNSIGKIKYQEVFNLFCKDYSNKYPIISENFNFYLKLAKKIQNGQHEEFIYSKDWLSIYWPPEEYLIIKMIYENKFEKFYEEVSNLLIYNFKDLLDQNIIEESVNLNKELFKRPFIKNDAIMKLNSNIYDVYKATILGKEVSINNTPCTITIERKNNYWINFNDWCEEVIWFGNRRGAYLYGNINKNIEIAGHH